MGCDVREETEGWRMCCDVGEVTERFGEWAELHLRHSSFSIHSLAFPTSQLNLQLIRCFTYVTSRSPIILSLLLRHRLLTYVTWRAAQRAGTWKHPHKFRWKVKAFIFQGLPCLLQAVTKISTVYISHKGRCVLYIKRVTLFSGVRNSSIFTIPSLDLRHSSVSNSSVVSPTSQLVLQPFFRFSYVTGCSLTSPDEPSMLQGVPFYGNNSLRWHDRAL